MDDDAHAESQIVVDLSHPVGVALGQVIVDGDHVHALSGERVQIDRQGADQGLALAGAHLGDASVVEHHAADQLHVVVPLAKHPFGRLAHHREGLFQKVVQALALGQPRLEHLGPGLELRLAQRRNLGLQRVDLADPRAHALDLALV